jgi:hypothetical protein
LFKDILTSKSDAALRRNIINIASKSSSSINEMRRELSRFTKLPTMANLVSIVFKTEGRCQQIQVNETTQKKETYHYFDLCNRTCLLFVCNKAFQEAVIRQARSSASLFIV